MEPRRSSTTIPPPPPLPPAKQSYFTRLVNAYGNRPPSAQTSRLVGGGRYNPLVPRIAGIRAGFSQDANHKTGLPIEALDINRDRSHAILAGKEILKTVRVHDSAIVEDINLRAAVINYADPTQQRQRDGLGIQDVKWSHGHFSTHIATAAANGKVILYDLNRAGVELARLHEHSRQVHKLAFNPHQGYLLLSASHDTTVRLWDLRDMRKDIMTCRSRDQYAGINGGIYDVQWSPTDGLEFAFGTDNGTIQRWDFRHSKVFKQKITAHDQKTCTSIDWHPDGKHLLSASVDRTVKVWDFSVGVRRQKPVFMLTAPYPVYNARWRPPDWSEEGAYQCTQLATAYDRDHPIIHLWDFRRPYLPLREINKFATAPSDMLWHSRDLLWTVGREGVFQQNDVHHAPKVVDRRSLQAIAVSPSGEVGGVAQRRPRRRRSTGLTYNEDTYMGDPRDKRGSPEKGSLRSSAGDSLDDSSFLTSKRHHGRTSSNRSAKSFGSTPPSDSTSKVMFLTDSLAMHDDSSRPNQLAFRGTLPGAFNVHVFAYLAQKYKAIPLPDPPTLQSFVDLQHVFEQNAEYAQRAAFYRLATTWRIVGVAISDCTQRRALLQRGRRRALARPARMMSSYDTQPKAPSQHLQARDNPTFQPDTITYPESVVEKLPTQSDGPVEPTHTVESTSNIATPLARPLAGPPSVLHDKPSPLPDIDRDEAIKLPPAVTGPHSEQTKLLTANAGSHPQSLSQPSFKGPHWHHPSDVLDERRAMVGSWRASPRVPLSLEPAGGNGLNIQIPPRLDRHDSDDSFAMFSASTDSQRGNSMPSSLASGKSRSHGAESMPENWEDPPGRSSLGKPRPPIAGAADPPPDALGKSIPISPMTAPMGKIEEDKSNTPPQQADQAAGSNRQAEEHSTQEMAVHDIETLRRNNQLLRHDSSESEAFTSSMSGMSAASFLDYGHEMEASGTIVPEGHDDAVSPQAVKPSAGLPHATEGAVPVLDPAAEDPLLLTDFQAMQVDPDEGSAVAIMDLLQSLLSFLTDSQADAQTASLLLLLLAPLLPRTRGDSEPLNLDAAGISSLYAETFTALGLSPTQVDAILSTQLSQLIATGINPYQAEAVLHTYHAQLHSLSLFNAAASLRRLGYPTYPAVYEQALKDTQVGLLCLSCKSPINNPKDKMRCETCKRAQAPCPICWGRYPALDAVQAKKKTKAKARMGVSRDPKRQRSSLVSSFVAETGLDANDGPSPSVPESAKPPTAMLWTWCPVCGHGGHTHCLSTWFASGAMSDGACATEGCLCDCVQGKRRDEKMEQTMRLKAEKDRAKVVRKGDDWKVAESKAVSAIRGALDDAPALRDAAQAAGSGSGAPSGRTKEEGRRVRLEEP